MVYITTSIHSFNTPVAPGANVYKHIGMPSTRVFTPRCVCLVYAGEVCVLMQPNLEAGIRLSTPSATNVLQQSPLGPFFLIPGYRAEIKLVNNSAYVFINNVLMTIRHYEIHVFIVLYGYIIWCTLYIHA